MVSFSGTAAPDLVNHFPIYLVIHTLLEADRAVGPEQNNKNKQTKTVTKSSFE